jgi:hypothetical protein
MSVFQSFASTGLSISHLLHQPDILSKPIEIELVDRAPIERDSTRLGVVPSFQEADDCALS